MPHRKTISSVLTIAAHLSLALLRVAARPRLQTERITDDDIIILLAIFLGHYEGRPFTAHKLAIYLGSPRPTIIRRTERLLQCELITRDRRGRFHTTIDLSSPEVIGATREIVQAISSACNRLSKMDTHILDDLRDTIVD